MARYFSIFSRTAGDVLHLGSVPCAGLFVTLSYGLKTSAFMGPLAGKIGSRTEQTFALWNSDGSNMPGPSEADDKLESEPENFDSGSDFVGESDMGEGVGLRGSEGVRFDAVANVMFCDSFLNGLLQ